MVNEVAYKNKICDQSDRMGSIFKNFPQRTHQKSIRKQQQKQPEMNVLKKKVLSISLRKIQAIWIRHAEIENLEFDNFGRIGPN